MTSDLAKLTIARLKTVGEPIVKVTMQPEHALVVLLKGDIVITFELTGPRYANVARGTSLTNVYFYPPRLTVDELMADLAAAKRGELYAE